MSVSEHDAKLHVTEGGKNNADSDKPNCGSPTVISCIDLPQSEKESQEGVRSAVGQNVPVPEVIDGVPLKGSSMSQDPKEDDSSKDERSFSFEVGALADLSEREAGKCWQPFSTQACKTSVVNFFFIFVVIVFKRLLPSLLPEYCQKIIIMLF